MRFHGFNLEDRELTFDHVEMWYDRKGRYWVVQSMTKEGYQIGDAIMVHSKREAIKERDYIISEAQKPIDKA